MAHGVSVNEIVAWESGQLGTEETVEMFAKLVRSGDAWTLQGTYGRTAARMIEDGVINRAGEIDYDRLQEIVDAL